MFFEDSRPDRRQKRAFVPRSLEASPIPPAEPYELMSWFELMEERDRTFVYDVECYPNYFLVAFQCVETGKVLLFEDSPGAVLNIQLLAYVMSRFKCVGFNSRAYDIVMVNLALKGVPRWKLKEVSDEIILKEMQAWEVEREFAMRPIQCNHIDLIEVAPIQASLKIYGGRLHCKRMQDLPFSPDTELTEQQAAIVRDYCVNDLDLTKALYFHLLPHIELREAMSEEYGQDLRSKSDAQISETVIVSELEKAGLKVEKPTDLTGTSFKYQVPEYLTFETPQLQHVLETVRAATFWVGASGSPDMPPEIAELDIRLGQCVYNMGIGGLHSTEKAAAHLADELNALIDRDVASYYPQIILNLGLFPPHLGKVFLEVYQSLVKRRLGAKFLAKKHKELNELEQAKLHEIAADSLKITINGGFGKLGNKYSKIYAPALLTQVTITGQLCLLKLIEMIELAGIPVISANTDGIVIRCPRDREKDLETVVIQWEELTGFTTEETRYKALYSRDVNNYIAVKEDDKCKVKGVYSERGSAQNSVLSKNPEGLIISEAVQAFLARGVPIADTVTMCKDIRKFVTVRNVKGGGEKDGVYLGKAVRWYHAVGETGTINYVMSGNKVPKSEGAKPCMILPDNLPNDIDYDHYVNEAIDVLYDVGFYRKPAVAKLF